MQYRTSEPRPIIGTVIFVLKRLLERENISKFATVYLGRHFHRKPGAATYAPKPLSLPKMEHFFSPNSSGHLRSDA